MKDSYINHEIISNQQVGEGIYRMEVKGDFSGNPGQFYMIRGWQGIDPFLPRPLSISDITNEGIVFLYEKRGKGTQLLSLLGEGDKISLMGPLGNGFTDIADKKVALISGGVGIAPLLYLAKSLKQKPDLYAGFATGEYYLYEFEEHTNKIVVATNDGSVGNKGNITQWINPKEYDLIISCGPTPMLSEVKRIAGNTSTLLSVESRMACGVGACSGCTCDTTAGRKQICYDGPVFKGEELFI